MQLSDGEKLILMMLCELYKHLNIDGEIDPDFVQQTIWQDHLWGFSWKYTGIPFAKEETPREVRETLDVLDMWWFIEKSYEKLSPNDKKRIEKEADPFGSHVQFDGFDGNNEPHFGMARYLIDHLEKYEDFKGRSLNSHFPSIERYKRMYRLFEPMRVSIGMNQQMLSADDIIKLLNTQTHPDHR
jgi:uncharacterized protein